VQSNVSDEQPWWYRASLYEDGLRNIGWSPKRTSSLSGSMAVQCLKGPSQPLNTGGFIAMFRHLVGRVISPSQRPIPTQDSTTRTNIHVFRRAWVAQAEFEPQISASKWSRPTPHTARPLRPAEDVILFIKYRINSFSVCSRRPSTNVSYFQCIILSYREFLKVRSDVYTMFRGLKGLNKLFSMSYDQTCLLRTLRNNYNN
jgi:hypothetical protein